MVSESGWPDIAAAYDVVAADYADKFADELEHKPLDSQWLDDFALVTAGQGPVWDAGCGPAGHITRFLADREVDVIGCDLSPGAVAEARRRHPDLDFRVADLRRLPVPDRSLAGIVAFYSLIHLPRPELPAALAEFRRVLKPTGALIVAMHSAETWTPEADPAPEKADPGELSATEFLGHQVETRVTLVYSSGFSGLMGDAGFTGISFANRGPYPGEYPTRRMILRAGPNEPQYLDPETWHRLAHGE